LCIGTDEAAIGEQHDKPAFLSAPFQMLVLATYCVAVPGLVGSYVFLLRSLSGFPSLLSESSNKARSLQRAWMILAAVLAVAAQFAATRNEIMLPSPNSPWVAGPEGSKQLTVAGALYYMLRGLDACMALGLVAVLLAMWFRIRLSLASRELVDFEFPGLGPTEKVRRLGLGLVLAIFFGSSITGLHGLALAIMANGKNSWGEKYSSNQKIALFTESTWLGWVVLTLLASVAAAAIVLWLRARIIDELRSMEARIQEKYKVAIVAGVDPMTLTDPKLRSDLIRAELEMSTKVQEIFSKAETWPFPDGAIPAILLSVAAQLVNFGSGLYTFLMAELQ
jgi:hypothetical protein